MERTFVTSSMIRSIGYDVELQVLEIEFNNGSVYQYSPVPQAEFEAMMTSGSHGTYFNNNIKPRYGFVKL